jgi:glycosyltransferase involved in cell wall biosynthesis
VSRSADLPNGAAAAQDFPPGLPARRGLSVCVVTQQLARVTSGVGLHANLLVRRLLADGHTVCVIAPVSERPPGDLPFRFEAVQTRQFTGSHARWIPLSWGYARALAALEDRGSFDLIHFTDARESLLCRPTAPSVGNVNDTYAAEGRPPAYYRRHYADWLPRWSYYSFLRMCERFSLPRLGAVIANSQFTASIVLTAYKLPPNRLHVCYKSIDSDSWASSATLREQAGLHGPTVLFVGGNMQRKGLPTLIHCARQVLAAQPTTRFWVVGADAAAEQMMTLVRREGVQAQFQFLGWRSQAELLQLYANADVFVLPALVEALGVVLLEAMAAGLPVVSTRVGGVPEIVEDGENGVLVEPDASQELGNALIRVLSDGPLRARLSRAGQERARTFSVDRMMNCTYAVYDSVLSGPGRPSQHGLGNDLA